MAVAARLGWDPARGDEDSAAIANEAERFSALEHDAVLRRSDRNARPPDAQ